MIPLPNHSSRPCLENFFDKIPQQINLVPSLGDELEQSPLNQKRKKNALGKKNSKKVDELYKITKGKWSNDEDAHLKLLISENLIDSTINWEVVLTQFSKWASENNLDGRNKKQCLEHYENLIKKGLKKGPFNEEEIKLLKSQYTFFPNQWAKLMKVFPGRTANAIKNCANHLFKKKELKKIKTTISRGKTPDILSKEIEQAPLSDIKLAGGSSPHTQWDELHAEETLVDVSAPGQLVLSSENTKLTSHGFSLLTKKPFSLDLDSIEDFEEELDEPKILSNDLTPHSPPPLYDAQFPFHYFEQPEKKRKRF